jgi:L-seryl-tRNA(Ser) seleniumtransferase
VDPGVRARLRELPPVDRLAGRVGSVSAARAVIEERRAELLAGGAPAGEADLEARARARLAPSLRRVLNATGVVVHTNLGRAPLGAAARAAVARAAEGSANLELDLGTGRRGSRHEHVEGLLRELTGAEAATVVNNCAGAVLLAVAALTGGRAGARVVVSRGQLVEIGGSFRVPDVVAQAGARLVEVGTTNRTRLRDYAAALEEGGDAVVLRAHPSNFRTVGFTEDVAVEALTGLGAPVVDDVGSGNLAELPVLDGEPPVRRSVRAGAALVCFSGDKLLGGPQAGIIVGEREAVAACRRHPLARALRVDVLSLAALEATLAVYRDPDRAVRELPVLRMLTEDPSARAARLAERTGGTVVQATARVGGGALPLLELPGPAVAISSPPTDPEAVAAALRAADPPVVGRISEGRVLLDPRTLTDEEVELVAWPPR